MQTKLGKIATNNVNETYKTNIEIGRVGLQFNGDVELKEILIKDYRLDTLIAVKELNTSIVSFKKLYNNKLNFGDIDVQGLVFNIKTYKGTEDTNLDIFVDKFEDNNPNKEPSGFLLSSSDVSIEDGTFRLNDENKESPKILELNDLNTNITDFVIKGPDVKTRINTLRFYDSRGVRVKNLMANFEYTLDHMDFQNLNIETELSELSGDLRFDYKREDLKEFTDKVNITAQFANSNIQLSELNVFFNEFGSNQKAALSVDLSGTLNNLTANNLKVSTTTNTRIIGDVVFKNMFNKEENNFVLDGNFQNLS
ncbi:MAG: translocation/assembly module TamB, partial [Bacteroidia bacterium]|nr:translocation/assembly module TamB [Bacteroidia bacterium]